MSRARENADGARLNAPLASPTFTGTTTVSGDLVPSTPMSHRNILINGAMTVAQRGTSSTSSGYQTVDRFKSAFSTGGTWTQSQSTDSPAGFANSYKNECTVAETDMANMGYAMIQQKIEGQLLQHLDFGTASPKKFTLSFWVKSSLTGTHVCQLHAPYIATTEYNSHAYTVNVADTWEYKTITWTGDTGDVIPNDFESSIRIYWFLAAGNGYGSGTLTNDLWHTTTANRAAGQVNLAGTVGNTFYLTGTQLEIGESATPFEHLGFGDELVRCQRYYQKSTPYATYPAHAQDGRYETSVPYTTNVCKMAFTLIGSMRGAPNMTFYGNAAGSGSKVGTYDGGSWGLSTTILSNTLGDGHVSIEITAGTTDAALLVNYQYEAEKEL
ncbi:MAG TPA: hypothetical protein DEZ08_09005 [Dehalococcoidia bacterium]|nr:hypothetical protein [Dehalococcoidia bacterium]